MYAHLPCCLHHNILPNPIYICALFCSWRKVRNSPPPTSLLLARSFHMQSVHFSYRKVVQVRCLILFPCPITVCPLIASLFHHPVVQRTGTCSQVYGIWNLVHQDFLELTILCNPHRKACFLFCLYFHCYHNNEGVSLHSKLMLKCLSCCNGNTDES